MKIIFSHNTPFSLAHGGMQTYIEAMMRVLPELGVEVEPEKWWDENQKGDIIHYFGRPSFFNLVALAQKKGRGVVMQENLDKTASRSQAMLFLQRLLIRSVSILLKGFVNRFAWGIYKEADAMMYQTELDWKLAQYLFNADPKRGYIIPIGVHEKALKELRKEAVEGDYLISIATIAPRKNSLLLAQAARKAQVPIVFLGKPYSENDKYFQEFKKLVDGKWVRYLGYVSEEEKIGYIRGARGFVLLSLLESGCIGLHEAAAAGLPLLLPQLPWALKSYPPAQHMEFVSLKSLPKIALVLSSFYKKAHRLSEPNFQVLSFHEIAKKYIEVYEKVLSK